MPGSIRKVIAGRWAAGWESPFVARLKRLVDLTPADIEALRALMECEAAVSKRRELVVEGYPYNKLSFIKEGVAARYKVLRNGKRQIINVLVPGDVIGLPASVLDRATCSVIALSDMKLETCPIEAFVAACYQRPKFALALSWLAAQEVATYTERVIDIGRRTAVERLAHFLLDIHARLLLAGRASAFGFDLMVSQEVMGDSLGLSVPHVNRMMARLRQEGMIVVTDRHVEFADIRALQQLAHFQPARPSRVPPPPEVTSGLAVLEA